MRVVDWLARTVMLVLASLATLALIGSLASVLNSTLGEAFPGRVAAPPSDAAPAPAIATVPPSPDADAPASASAATARAVAAGAEDRAEIARWLKALTYALLALGGFVAAGVIALVRIAGNLGRIADR